MSILGKLSIFGKKSDVIVGGDKKIAIAAIADKLKLAEKAKTANVCGFGNGSNVVQLAFDGTYSMNPVMAETKKCINRLNNRVHQLSCEIETSIIVYRDYEFNSNLINVLHATKNVNQLSDFVNRVECLKGGDNCAD